MGKPKKPPTRLVAKTKGTKRNPDGKPRCQRYMTLEEIEVYNKRAGASVRERSKKRTAEGKTPLKWQPKAPNVGKGRSAVWQCTAAARDGYSVCIMHGAGSKKRVAEGKRTEPNQTSLVTGQYAKPDTLALLRKNNPAFAAIERSYLESPVPFEMRTLVATGRALCDLALTRVDGLDQASIAELMMAIDAIRQSQMVITRAIEAEQKQGPITHELLDRIQQAFGQVLVEYVPAGQLDDARRRWVDLVRLAGDKDGGVSRNREDEENDGD